MNRVKLYSNGTAVISREYELRDGQPLALAIPVRKSDLDDVITSISVFGAVTIIDPPSYSPTNAQETALTLNPASALKEMATKLAGAAVEIHAGAAYKGRLVGFQGSRRERDGAVVEQIRIVILTEKGVQQIEELAITAIRFNDPAIQSEIEKALRSSVAAIKPDSSVVELTIKPQAGPTTAVVVYATPVAAWKIRYQLRMTGESAELEGHAVVDNDTDDDWTNTLITVVSGEPITFSTDLAEISRPARSLVRMVAVRAAGAVIAAPVMEAVMSPPSPDDDLVFMALPVSASAPPPSHRALARAKETQAEVQHGGDFSIFTSPNPVTIAAKRSAIIPLFRTAVTDCAISLFYKERDDPHRPFRAIRFKNPADFSLGRGVCEVMIDGEFRGKSILGPVMPGEEALLIHAKETGARIAKEWGRMETHRLAVKISKGTVHHQELHRRTTLYRAINHHPEPFTLEIEHRLEWKDSTLEIASSEGACQALEIDGGKRLRATLPARGSLEIRVKEWRIESRSFALDVGWLHSNLFDRKGKDPEQVEIQNCVKIQKQIDGLKDDLAAKEAAARTINAEQERLLKMIPKAHDEQANAWRTDLGAQENELRLINRVQIPELKAERKKAEAELQKALGKVSYTWSGEQEPAEA